MALKDLKTSTMVTITAPWLDPKKQRPALERLTRVSGLLPDIAAAHQGLIKFQKKESVLSTALGKLAEKAAALDETHDRKARGLFNITTGIADLSDDDSFSDAILVARDELMPTGLQVVTPSYRDEAGAAALVEERLTPESKKLLKETQVAGKPLAKWVDGWLRAAHELGEVEAERVKLQGRINDEPNMGGDVVRARNHWIRVVSTVLQVLELEKDLDVKTRKSVIEQLDAALAKAGRRTGKSREEDGAVEDVQSEAPPVDAVNPPA